MVSNARSCKTEMQRHDILKNHGNMNIKDRCWVTPLGLQLNVVTRDVLDILIIMICSQEKRNTPLHWHTSWLTAEVFQERKRKLARKEIAIHALFCPSMFLFTPSLPSSFPSTYGITLVLINEVFLKYGGLKVHGCNAYSQSRADSGEHLSLCLYSSYFAFEFYICHNKYFML